MKNILLLTVLILGVNYASAASPTCLRKAQTLLRCETIGSESISGVIVCQKNNSTAIQLIFKDQKTRSALLPAEEVLRTFMHGFSGEDFVLIRDFKSKTIVNGTLEIRGEPLISLTCY